MGTVSAGAIIPTSLQIPVLILSMTNPHLPARCASEEGRWNRKVDDTEVQVDSVSPVCPQSPLHAVCALGREGGVTLQKRRLRARWTPASLTRRGPHQSEL